MFTSVVGKMPGSDTYRRPLSGKRATTNSLPGSRREMRISPSAGTMPVRAVMFTWWVTSTTGRLRSAEAIHARSASVCPCSRSEAFEKGIQCGQLDDGTCREITRRLQAAAPLAAPVVLANSRCPQPLPIRAACSRPSLDRLRCVEQSPSRKFGGSPVPGGKDGAAGQCELFRRFARGKIHVGQGGQYTEQCSAEYGIRIRKTSRVSSLSFHRSQVTGH